MSNFAVVEIKEVKAKEKVFKLLVNGKCLFDEFYKEIEKDGNLQRELYKIMATLESVCNGFRLPDSKFKELKRKKNDEIKDFEIKSTTLRLYFFKDNNERIIVLGGKKGTQAKDILKLRKIKNDYFNQL